MNISTLAKLLGVSIADLRREGDKLGLKAFSGRNTRIPYNDAVEVTKILRPDKAKNLENDDKIYLPARLTVHELAECIGKPPGIVVKTLVMNGVLATLNETIDYETANIVSSELGIEVFPEKDELESQDAKTEVNEKVFQKTDGKTSERAPIVTVMGHVDHGKTTLLDTIRKSNVAAGEAGAITQHISSYQVKHKNKKITFVDTPGHEAFSAMRARGTQLADFIILVVSATEGPKPQTVEVIERAKISTTPLIVAINKIDLPEADIEKTKADIAAYGVVPEEWGGTVPFVPISAKNGTGIDTLLETILLHAEVSGLVGSTTGQGKAIVLESHKDKSNGVIATVIVTHGKLTTGDIIVYGSDTGKIRRIKDSNGNIIEEAHLTEPVEITGLTEVANTGDTILVMESLKEAQKHAAAEALKSQKRKMIVSRRVNSDEDITLVLKADVTGSLEALKEGILKIPHTQAQINILDENVGDVTESDLDFAHTTGATILAFHTNTHSRILDKAKTLAINLIASDIIYELLEWVEEQILARTKHETRIDVLGTAEVLAVFNSDKPKIQIFGGEAKTGKLLDNKPYRIMRGGKEVGRLEIQEIQKNKVRAKEVNPPQQFGVSATGNTKVMIGDTIECIDEVVV